MNNKGLLQEVIEKAPNRRSFLTKVGIAGAALGVAQGVGLAQSSSGPSDADILNFALNLEYLEAEFYNINVPIHY